MFQESGIDSTVIISTFSSISFHYSNLGFFSFLSALCSFPVAIPVVVRYSNLSFFFHSCVALSMFYGAALCSF